ELEYLGRFDEQVKVRGYRIELGEIEAALSKHEKIRQCAVSVKENEVGDKRLVAYVVGSNHDVPTDAELHAYLREKLPKYMAPAVFIELQELPLTANGKLDRRALALIEPEVERKGYLAPANQVEKLLCQIWADTLGLERVGVRDNFFGLGGDSILSIQVIARA